MEPVLQSNFLDGTFESVIVDEYTGRVNNYHGTHIQHFEYGQMYEVLMINNDPQEHPWDQHEYSVDFITAGKLPRIQPSACNQTQRCQTDEPGLDALLPSLNSTPPVVDAVDPFNTPPR